MIDLYTKRDVKKHRCEYCLLLVLQVTKEPTVCGIHMGHESLDKMIVIPLQRWLNECISFCLHVSNFLLSPQ
jgi:hypothetical protein